MKFKEPVDENTTKAQQELKRLQNRAGWSWDGWVHCWQEEPSLRSWVWANLVSAALAIALDITSAERALVMALGILILVVELLNTSIERAVDHTSQEQNPLAKQAKDTASAAVVVTAIAAGVAWAVILVGVFLRSI